ncbi:hypothetical protein MAR_031431 [Mya arenaria]|uniref:Uncharacterized protein n=1 Tax=Mya arenaria TaxID=6604 RepID=A0ABY7F3T7_MYAAR|nr:hypothetical protein MAR_031431 [Mya arenaria]
MYGQKCEYKCPESCEVRGENSKCDFEALEKNDETVSHGPFVEMVNPNYKYSPKIEIKTQTQEKQSGEKRKLPGRQPAKSVTSAMLEIDENDACGRDFVNKAEDNDGAYYNDANDVNTNKVPVESLARSVYGKTDREFEEEFQNFPSGLTKSYHASHLKENVSKNRYRGIYPCTFTIKL